MSVLKKLLNYSKLAQYETEQKKKYKQYVKAKKTDVKLFCKSEPEIYEDVLTELRKSFRGSKRKSSTNIQKDRANNNGSQKASSPNNCNSNTISNQKDPNRTSSSTRKDSIRSRTSIKQFRAPLPPQTSQVQNLANHLDEPKSQDEKKSKTNESNSDDWKQVVNTGTSKTSNLDQNKLVEKNQIELTNMESSKSFSYAEQGNFMEHLDFELKTRHHMHTNNLEPLLTIIGNSSEETTAPQPKPRRPSRSERRNKDDGSSQYAVKLPNDEFNINEDVALSTIPNFGDGFSETLQEAKNEHVQFNKNLHFDRNFEISTHDASQEGMTNYLPDVQLDVISTLGSESESVVHTRSRKDSFTTIASDDTFYDCEDFKESGTWQDPDQYKPSLDNIKESDGQLDESEKLFEFDVHQVLNLSIEDHIQSCVDDPSPTHCSSDDTTEPIPLGTGFEELFFQSYEPKSEERQFFGMEYIWSEPERHKSKEIIYIRPASEDVRDVQKEENFNISNSKSHAEITEYEDDYTNGMSMESMENQLHLGTNASKLEDLVDHISNLKFMNEDVDVDDVSNVREPCVKSIEMDTHIFQNSKDVTSSSNNAKEDVKDIQWSNSHKSNFKETEETQFNFTSRNEKIKDADNSILTILQDEKVFQNLKNDRLSFNVAEEEIETNKESNLPKVRNKPRIFRQTSLQYPTYKNDNFADTKMNEDTRRVKTYSFSQKPSRLSWEPGSKYEPVFSSNLFDTYKNKFYTSENKHEDDKKGEIKDFRNEDFATKCEEKPEGQSSVEADIKEISKTEDLQEEMLQSFEFSILRRVKEGVLKRLKTEESNSKPNDGESKNEANFLDAPLISEKPANTELLKSTKKYIPEYEDLPKSPKKVTFKLDEPYSNRYIGNNKFPKYSNTYANEKFPQLQNDEYESINEEILYDDETYVNAPKSLQNQLILGKLKLKSVESDSEDKSGKFDEADLPASFIKNLNQKKIIGYSVTEHDANNQIDSFDEECEFKETNMPQSLFKNLNLKKSKLNRYEGTSNVLHHGTSNQEFRTQFEETNAPKSLIDHINVSKARLRRIDQTSGFENDGNMFEDTTLNTPRSLKKKVSFKKLKFNERTQNLSTNSDETSEESEVEYKSERKSNNDVITSLNVPIDTFERRERYSTSEELNDETKLGDDILKEESSLENLSTHRDTFSDYSYESSKSHNAKFEEESEDTNNVANVNEHSFESDFNETKLRGKNDENLHEATFVIGDKNLEELSDILASVNSNKDFSTQIRIIEEIIININRKIDELDSKSNEDYPLIFHMLLQSMRIVSGLPQGLGQNLLDAQQNILSDIRNCISIMNNKKVI